MILFFTRAQLEARLSAQRVQRLFDDNNDGTADTDVIAQLRQDASSKVTSYLGALGMMARVSALANPTTGELLDAAKPFPQEVTRLALDVAFALSCQRFPDVMRMDWQPLMAQADKDLCNLRDGKTSLGGQGAPEPLSKADEVADNATSLTINSDQRITNNLGDF